MQHLRDLLTELLKAEASPHVVRFKLSTFISIYESSYNLLADIKEMSAERLVKLKDDLEFSMHRDGADHTFMPTLSIALIEKIDEILKSPKQAFSEVSSSLPSSQE